MTEVFLSEDNPEEASSQEDTKKTPKGKDKNSAKVEIIFKRPAAKNKSPDKQQSDNEPDTSGSGGSPGSEGAGKKGPKKGKGGVALLLAGWQLGALGL